MAVSIRRRVVLSLIVAAMAASGLLARSARGEEATKPLELYQSRTSAFSDCALTGPLNGRVVGDVPYYLVREEGLIFREEHPTLVPLKLYRRLGHWDYATVASPESERALQEAGYQFLSIEGYIYPNEFPGGIPLRLFWNEQRQDYCTVASERAVAQHRAFPYTEVRIEGYVLPR
jgi:hypothetical protein